MSTRPEIIVRAAINADGGRIKTLIYSVLTEYDLVPEPDGTDSDIENVEANYIDRGGVFEVLESADGRLLGTAGLYPMPSLGEGVVELRKMYFAPELRGHGLGKETLTRMIERARGLGFTRIYLETASQLKEAIGLYRKFGFTQTSEGMHSCRCDQAFYLDL